jgi:hypothetical protein
VIHTHFLQPLFMPSAEDGEHGKYDEDEQMIMNSADPEQIAKMQEAKARRNARQQPKLSELTSISGSGRTRMVGAPSSDKKKKKRKSY